MRLNWLVVQQWGEGMGIKEKMQSNVAAYSRL